MTGHDTPIIGGTLSSAQAAQAKAPWFNNIISDSDLIPKEMATFKQEGVFAGKKVAVVGTTTDQAEMDLVLPALRKVKADVVQTAVNSAPETDTAAQTQQYNVIAQKFEVAGANVVVAVGNAGNGWPASLQSNQSTYMPRLVATDYIDLDAYVSNKLGYSQAILKNALTAGGYPPLAVTWDDPGHEELHRHHPRRPSRAPPSTTRSRPRPPPR